MFSRNRDRKMSALTSSCRAMRLAFACVLTGDRLAGVYSTFVIYMTFHCVKLKNRVSILPLTKGDQESLKT